MASNFSTMVDKYIYQNYARFPNLDSDPVMSQQMQKAKKQIKNMLVRLINSFMNGMPTFASAGLNEYLQSTCKDTANNGYLGVIRKIQEKASPDELDHELVQIRSALREAYADYWVNAVLENCRYDVLPVTEENLQKNRYMVISGNVAEACTGFSAEENELKGKLFYRCQEERPRIMQLQTVEGISHALEDLRMNLIAISVKYKYDIDMD